LMRDGAQLSMGFVGIVLPDTNSGARPFATIQGFLRPALDVLVRELVNQYNIDDLQRNLSARDGDLELLLDASGAESGAEHEDFDRLVRACTKHLDCAFGAPALALKFWRARIGICLPGHKCSAAHWH
jgi:hypothetical protein